MGNYWWEIACTLGSLLLVWPCNGQNAKYSQIASLFLRPALSLPFPSFSNVYILISALSLIHHQINTILVRNVFTNQNCFLKAFTKVFIDLFFHSEGVK